MKFTSGSLATLMSATPGDPVAAAERANLCMEERVSANRQTAYEARVDDPGGWEDWRERHFRYVQEEVRRRYPPSAAFTAGEPSLRSGVEPNQYLYRVERIDSLLGTYGTTTGAPVGVEQIREWISARDSRPPATNAATSLGDLGRLMAGDTSSPQAAALQELTDLFNEERTDGRPSFVAFAAEFLGLEKRPDWATHICRRCGLAHFFSGSPVTLALFRYRVGEVVAAHSGAGSGATVFAVPTVIDRLDGLSFTGMRERGATVFAVPTVIDQPMSNVYFTAPKGMDWGHAIGLAPEPDCRHLAAELIHARIDYQPEHWVAVDTLEMDSLSATDVERLREAHLGCIRRTSGNADYGRHC